ncbi:MAG: ATP-dependent Clp protease proteolytic subunit [Prevotella sp.]|nr:ATP-dependent Clp protease proteolytic subunit [Prevotella sp.]
MATSKYHLHLKGYVGGWDFDADYVDYILGKYDGKEVNVLIDSLGGRTDTALSIYAAFKRHGKVNAHFVGMNASAATIASLGAQKITIDVSAMYLVHKCSYEFFKWSMLNADDMAKLIDSLNKDKEDLDKVDATVAALYARKCKKSPEEMLNLMSKGGWLTAKEAMEWGFVDEVTDLEEDAAPVIDNATVQALADAGIPMPKGLKPQGSWNRFLASLTEFFSNKEDKSSPTGITMKKEYQNIQARLVCEAFETKDGKVEVTEEQLDKIEAKVKKDDEVIKDLNEQISILNSQISNLKSQIVALEKKPAESSQQVVSEKKTSESNSIEEFVNAKNEAQSLYDMFD